MIRIVMFSIIMVYFLHLFMRQGTRNHKKATDETRKYMERERQANLSRAKPIDTDYFITVNEKDIPIINNMAPPVERLYLTCLQSSQLKMVRLPPDSSNQELKENFGVTHFQELVQYEDNLRQFMHNCNFYAEALLEANQLKESKEMLDLLVNLHSDISKTYILYWQLLQKAPSAPDTLYLNEQIRTLNPQLQQRITNHVSEEESYENRRFH